MRASRIATWPQEERHGWSWYPTTRGKGEYTVKIRVGDTPGRPYRFRSRELRLWSKRGSRSPPKTPQEQPSTSASPRSYYSLANCHHLASPAFSLQTRSRLYTAERLLRWQRIATVHSPQPPRRLLFTTSTVHTFLSRHTGYVL